jgi:hypothetical protein
LSEIPTLLQGLTLISGTQTGCRRLDSYIEQKKFLACGPEFSVEFSAPPEFSGGVLEKQLCTGRARTSDPQITNPVLYQCATVNLVPNFNFKSIYTDVSSVGPVSCVHALALVHDVAGIHAIESVSSAVSPTVTSVHALVFTHALAGTHVLACVSEVIGSSVAGVVAL